MSRIDYPREEVWEAVFYKTIELALDRPHLMLLPERRNILEPLEYLEGAEYPGDCVDVREGATYKSLAYIAHRFGFKDEDRQLWYRIANRLCLSQAHIGCIIARLNERDQLFSELDELVSAA